MCFQLVRQLDVYPKLKLRAIIPPPKIQEMEVIGTAIQRPTIRSCVSHRCREELYRMVNITLLG